MYQRDEEQLPFGLRWGVSLYGFIGGITVWFWTGVFFWEWLGLSLWFFLALVLVSWIPATIAYWVFLAVYAAVFGPLIAFALTVFKNNAFGRFAIGTAGAGAALGLTAVILWTGWLHFQVEEESEVELYAERLGSILAPLADAQDAWNAETDNQRRLDPAQLDAERVRELGRRARDAISDLATEADKALKEMRLIRTPQQCQELHLVTTEAVQHTELAAVELKRYFQLALSGVDNDASWQRGNQAFQDADRAKQRGLFAVGDCK